MCFRFSFVFVADSVVFGLMTIVSQQTTPWLKVFGIKIPFALAPFGALIITQLMFRQASFIVVVFIVIIITFLYFFLSRLFPSLVLHCLLYCPLYSFFSTKQNRVIYQELLLDTLFRI